MKATFSIASPIATCGTVPVHPGRVMPPVEGRAPESTSTGAPARIGLSRYQVAEALMTLAVMAWLSAALAGMVGEWRGAPPEPSTPPAATRDGPNPLPQALSRPQLASARAGAIACA
jgi:hypothetical protein